MDKKILIRKPPPKGIIILISVIIIILVGIIYYKSFICIADFNGNMLTYKGSIYEECGTSNYKEGKFLCKTKDGRSTIYALPGDDDNNFLGVRSFLDNRLYKKKDYEIPKSGNVTSIYIKNAIYDNKDIISVLQQLEDIKGESYSFKTDNIYSCAENIIYCYNGCPVGGKWICRIAHVDDKWIYINTDLNDNVMHASSYIGTIITEDKYISVLEQYISK